MPIRQTRIEPDALAELRICGIPGQTRRRGFRIQLLDRRTRRAVISPDFGNTPIQLAEQGKTERRVYRPDRIRACDGLPHPKIRPVRLRAFLPETKVNQLVQRYT